MAIEIRAAAPEELGNLVVPILTTFGMPLTPERIARHRDTPELDLRIGAYDEGAVVGGLASFTFTMTVPGSLTGGLTGDHPSAFVETAGTTMVGVLPTHRRQGILRAMMRRYLDDVRARGQVLSALFASEGPIYGRFGYGLASLTMDADIEQGRSAFLGPAPPAGRTRLVSEEEALAAFPPIFDRVRREIPGMISRSVPWWRLRRLMDPDWLRAGRAGLQRALLEIDGQARGYAIYRPSGVVEHGIFAVTVEVLEAMGDSPAATRAIFRYLLDFDLVTRVKVAGLPVDHPLLFLAAEPARLHLNVHDALRVRLVDVAGALSARGYGPGGPLVLEVQDLFCPWNDGRYKLEDGKARRTDAAPDVRLDVEALGSAYLGAFSFTQLALAGRVQALRDGALPRADALFRASRAPWAPEIF